MSNRLPTTCERQQSARMDCIMMTGLAFGKLGSHCGNGEGVLEETS